MQPKARILSALKGEEIDRVPWSPFLAYWWDMQSEMIKALGQMEFMQSIGADPLLRGMGAAWHMER